MSEWDEGESNRSRGPRDPSEGVRIIGPDEAAQVAQRGDVQPRLRPDRPRYGDRPSPPPTDGPRPSMRFPLDASADPSEFERPPVVPTERHRPPTELSHWDESALEEVPNMSPRDPYEGDEAAWSSVPGAGPRWQDDEGDQRGGYDTRQAPPRRGPRPGESEQFDDYTEPSAGRSVFGDDPSGVGRIERDDYADGYDDPAYGDDYGSSGYTDDSYDDRGGRPPRGEREPDRGQAFDPPGRDDLGGHPGPAEGFDRRQVYAQPSTSDSYGDEAYTDDLYDDSPSQEEYVETPSRQRAAATRRPSGGGDRDMKTAASVGIGMIVLALVLFKVGTVATMVLVLAVLGMAAYEYFDATKRAGFDPLMPVGVTAAVGGCLAAYDFGERAIPMMVVLSVVVCVVWYLIGAGGERPMANIGATLLGICWIGVFGSFAGLLLGGVPGFREYGISLLLAAIVPTIGYDVGALFVGRSAGSRPLSPASPNKTVEGLVGGMVLALVAGLLLGMFGPAPFDSAVEGLKIGLVVAIAAPLGDLSESLIKRDLGIKDMGTLLPGHGGVLDRFDAILFVLPAVWYLASVSDFFVA